ncbi:helix-turn-helix domain-containing protein [Streptomyces erythrochromogenes]|uniref:PucR family transcriptional regulator n=1 Tax=Streptomyces erythrochromogenes TaxID=285574 RepID=UPI003323D8A9
MVTEDARALAVRCEARANSLARRLSREFFESVPGYDRLPADLKDLEIAATVRHGVRTFLRGVVAPPSAADAYRIFAERAGQRADEGVPLDLLLRAYAVGVHGLWEVLRREARPGEETALAELVDLLLRTQSEVVGVVTRSYLDAAAALAQEDRSGHDRLVRDVLDGTCHPEEARARGLSLDGPLLLVAFAPRAPRDEDPGGHGSAGRGADGARAPHGSPHESPDGREGGAVVRRRRLRGVRAALGRSFGTDVPAVLEPGHDGRGTVGRALVAGRSGVPEDLAGSLSRGYGRPVHVAAVPAPDASGIAEASRTAVEIVRIARARGLAAEGPGHRLDDVLLEFHLSRPGPSGDRIAALLDPVACRPELLATLRTHLELCRDRRATAARLGVHPNTVDKRLARLTALTGLDLALPHDSALALAAQLLREARAEGPRRDPDGG